MSNRWCQKVAIVTGASSGIGSRIAKDLIESGMIVIGLARRVDRMELLKTQFPRQFYSFECDVSSWDSIRLAFEWILRNFGKIHVLINNAGLLRFSGILSDDNEHDLKTIIDVNLMGAIYCTKEFYKIMRNMDEECHIININSILGHTIPFSLASMTYNMYPSSKFALRAATEVMRQELADNNNFRISSISPGLVKTEIVHSAGHPRADLIMNSKAILNVEDISRAVLFVLQSPKHVQISEMLIMPVGQKY